MADLAATRFPNPCPVCGVTDEHAAWRSTVTGSPCTYCPHPAEPGHGTGCCCAGVPDGPAFTLLAAPAQPRLRQSLTTRQGRKVPRMLYQQAGDEPADDDPIVGLVDTPELAALIVAAVNAYHVPAVTCPQEWTPEQAG